MDVDMAVEHDRRRSEQHLQDGHQQETTAQNVANGSQLTTAAGLQDATKLGTQQQQQHQDGVQTSAPQQQPAESRRERRQREQQEPQGPNVENWWLSESEGEGSEDDRKERVAQTEDPFYDPDADDGDEAWAVEQRSGRTTDAILSCPGCFTTLSIDCQQHELYHTQYRAMFTQNCEVRMDEVLKTKVQQQQPRSRKRRMDADAAGGGEGAQQDEQDVLHPVYCAVCGTQVGAQDADEVVHFFSVLASEC